MPKTRLNKSTRAELMDYVFKVVSCPDEESAVEAAYKAAEPLVRLAVEKTYPPKDMKVCAKYKAAQIDDCIKLKLDNDQITVFDFRADTGPMVVKPTYRGQIYEANKTVTKAVLAWEEAVHAHKEALKTKRTDYRALIQASRTFEEVVEVWSEAETLRPEICKPSTALTILSAETISRIQADVESRKSDD